MVVSIIIIALFASGWALYYRALPPRQLFSLLNVSRDIPLLRLAYNYPLFKPSPDTPETAESYIQVYDFSYQLSEELYTIYGLRMGNISPTNITDLGQTLPITGAEQYRYATTTAAARLNLHSLDQELNSLVPKPPTATRQNLLIYPKYNISAPIQHASFVDIFHTDSNQKVDLNRPILEQQADIDKGNYLSTPVQRLLTQGVVRMPYSVFPGEIGNSYIVGHSSNFKSVQSDYNFIFAPLVHNSRIGEEFIIFDQYGRELKFRVFDVLEISETDTIKAYASFADKRVVTLQASILESINGQLKPTKRWLTRGELIL